MPGKPANNFLTLLLKLLDLLLSRHPKVAMREPVAVHGFQNALQKQLVETLNNLLYKKQATKNEKTVP